jgi:hypothetical protein
MPDYLMMAAFDDEFRSVLTRGERKGRLPSVIEPFRPKLSNYPLP